MTDYLITGFLCTADMAWMVVDDGTGSSSAAFSNKQTIR